MDECNRLYGIPEDHIERYILFTMKNGSFPFAIDILQEECGELIQALSKVKRGEYGCRDSVVEEMAHVLISCGVVSRLLSITQADIDEEVSKKDALV